MQFTFIKASAAISAVAITSAALAGGGDTYEVSFSDVGYFNIATGGIDPTSPNYNGQGVAADAGRYFASFGWSNTVLDVCWNTGSGYSCWASECTFAMTMTDGTDTGFFNVGNPIAVDTGSEVEGACATYPLDGTGAAGQETLHLSRSKLTLLVMFRSPSTRPGTTAPALRVARS